MVNKPKNKGTSFETAVVRYLRWALDDPRIDRMALHGNNDTGDITGIYYAGERVVVECKNTKQPNYAKYWQQTLDEMGNADTCFAALVRHRPGVGYASLEGVGAQQVILDKSMLGTLIKTHDNDCVITCRRLLNAKPIPRTSLYEITLSEFAHWLNRGLPLGSDESVVSV